MGRENIHRFPFAYLLGVELERKKTAGEGPWANLGAEDRGIRTLARILAVDWPEGATEKTIEIERRALRKYLYQGVVPTPTKRRRIAVALDLDADFFFQQEPGYERARLERRAVNS